MDDRIVFKSLKELNLNARGDRNHRTQRLIRGLMNKPVRDTTYNLSCLKEWNERIEHINETLAFLHVQTVVKVLIAAVVIAVLIHVVDVILMFIMQQYRTKCRTFHTLLQFYVYSFIG